MGSAARRMAPLFAPLLVLATATANAAQGNRQVADNLPAGYEVGESLVCDTLGQVELFADLFTGDAQTAIRVVNEEEHNPSACGLVNVAFMRGDKHGVIRHGDTTFEVVHILVVGIETERGLRAVRPAAYYTLFSVKEFGA